MEIVAVRYRNRPTLWDQIPDLSAEVWPEYNLHGDILNRYWARLYQEFEGFSSSSTTRPPARCSQRAIPRPARGTGATRVWARGSMP